MKLRELIEYFNFRKDFLTEEQEKNNGNLQCVYCGKEHLEIGYTDLENSNKNKSNPNLATVDHIIPKRFKEDERLNKELCVVACKKCNQAKRDMHPSMIKTPVFGNMKKDSHKAQYFSIDGMEIKPKAKEINTKKEIKIHMDSFSNKKLNLEEDFSSVMKIFISQNIPFEIVDKIISYKFIKYHYSKSGSYYFSHKKEFSKLDDGVFRLSKRWIGLKTNFNNSNSYWTLCEYKDRTYNEVLTVQNNHVNNRKELVVLNKNINSVNIKDIRELYTKLHTLIKSDNLFVKINESSYKLLKYGTQEIKFLKQDIITSIKNSEFSKIKSKIVLHTKDGEVIKNHIERKKVEFS